jgi:hypothetical protein
MRNEPARIGAALALALSGLAASGFAQKPPATPPPDAPPATGTTEAAPAPVAAAGVVMETAPVAPASTGSDELDVTEKDGKRYVFIGLRYRGAIVPQAFMNIFTYGGATLYSNSVGLEVDVRKDGFSLIPNLTYTEYSSGNMIFLQHSPSVGGDADPGNWSMVNSGIKVLYLGADMLWSIHLQKNIDLELGLGFGIGLVFGSLVDNWVYATNNPNATSTVNGQTYQALPGSNAVSGYKGYFLPCATQTSGFGCATSDHMNATTAKVGGFTEPHGFNPVPTVFLNVSIPYLGVRIKPIKSVEGRLGLGFNLPNGFFFGFSGDYGLEKLTEKK